MHKKLSMGLTLGLIGNLFFVLFGIICFFYYQTFGVDGIVIEFIEVIAYACEAAGFICLLTAIILISRTVRMRIWLKISFPVYILAELVLMVFELNSYRLEFYEPYSLALAIVHAVFSALVCFTFLLLDPGKVCLEVMIVVAFGIILGGMLGNILGIRIYFSIITNAVAYSILFGSIKWMLSREMIEIDCHGDKARVAEYRSTFF